MEINFDNAINVVVQASVKIVGEDALDNGSIIFVRDFIGEITVVIRNKNFYKFREDLEKRLKEFEPYISKESVVNIDELFDESLSANQVGYLLPSKNEAVSFNARVVDRRLVGADWQKYPAEEFPDVPVVVFWSIKGGVGRSTALCVAAANCARMGLNVLAIDLDLEAPGIGGMLLEAADRPNFGALDYFVELGLGSPRNGLIEKIVAPSRFTLGGGLISVVPAVGLSTEKNPESMLAKLARAYLDKEIDGSTLTFSDQVKLLVSDITSKSKYDVVFLDVRAGLNESTPASVLGVGGTVLMFGIDTPQTFADYRYFFSHINRFAVSEGSNDWRSRLQMVHAKASALDRRRSHWREKSFDLFSEWIYDEATHDNVDAFNFDLDDVDAPHYGWPILHDAGFVEFDPLSNPDQLSAEISVRTFGPFIDKILEMTGHPD